jgi:hypothetical protein
MTASKPDALSPLDIEIFGSHCVLLDELSSWIDLITH